MSDECRCYESIRLLMTHHSLLITHHSSLITLPYSSLITHHCFVLGFSYLDGNHDVLVGANDLHVDCRVRYCSSNARKKLFGCANRSFTKLNHDVSLLDARQVSRTVWGYLIKLN